MITKKQKVSLGLFLLGAGLYLFPFLSDISWALLMYYFGFTFVEATWVLYIITSAAIILGTYLAFPRKFNRIVKQILGE